MRIKICGVTRADQGRAIAQLGASALGFICALRSPRFVTPDQIRAIVDQLPTDSAGEPQVARVGVFVDASVEMICQTVQTGRLSAVQLHGSEPPEFCQTLREMLPAVELLKAFRVRIPKTLENTILYEAYVDTLLLDAYHPTLGGGTGQTLDWKTLQSFSPCRPWLLAGGLNPDNVGEALMHLHPSGLDLSSGVERSPGDKDLNQVKRLFEQLRAIA